MGTTGLIFALVVVIWAVFLVPWALRRYDEAVRSRSIDTFSRTMRVLGRRAPPVRAAGETTDEPAPTIAARRSLWPTGATSSALLTRRASPAGPNAAATLPTRAAARVAARRRRRTLLTLLGLAVVVGALTVTGVLAWEALVVALALVVGFLALCRAQVRGEDDATWRRAGDSAPTAARPPAERPRRASRVNSSYGSVPHAPMGDEPDDEPTIVLSAEAFAAREAQSATNAASTAPTDALTDDDLVETVSAAVPVSTSDGASLWDPLPVTLPTYVSKPKAARTIRTIDLDAPKTWTSGHVAIQDTDLPPGPAGATQSGPATDRAANGPAAASADDEAPHRRAVGS